MTDRQWRELVRAMHAVDQNIMVITMVFENYTHRGQHKIEAEGYHGKAYYPSRLYPDRMPIASKDPLETIFSGADRLGMHVMPGGGNYAFFDYTPGALAWSKRVADELWQRYGHHRSFYGWYVTAEKDGSLGSEAERAEIVSFFEQFTPHVRRLAPDKPVMLAPNSYHLKGAEPAYRKLLPHLDILCPFGFHRMQPGDLTGEQAAATLQALCDQSGTHLWMDLESFLFLDNVGGGPLATRRLPDPVETRLREFTADVEAEKRHVESHRGSVAERQERLANVAIELEQLSRQLEEMVQSQAAYQSRLHVLEQLQSEREGYSAGALAALQQTQQVLGSLADRLRVPEPYVTAVEAALGHHLQLVLTAEPETARQILADLRAGHKGRASVAPLSFWPDSVDWPTLPDTPNRRPALAVIEAEAKPGY